MRFALKGLPRRLEERTAGGKGSPARRDGSQGQGDPGPPGGPLNASAARHLPSLPQMGEVGWTRFLGRP